MCFLLDKGQEGRVGEGGEGVEEVLCWVAREEQDVDGRFGVEVVDYDEVRVVGDDAGGREAFGCGYVFEKGVL